MELVSANRYQYQKFIQFTRVSRYINSFAGGIKSAFPIPLTLTFDSQLHNRVLQNVNTRVHVTDLPAYRVSQVHDSSENWIWKGSLAHASWISAIKPSKQASSLRGINLFASGEIQKKK